MCTGYCPAAVLQLHAETVSESAALHCNSTSRSRDCMQQHHVGTQDEPTPQATHGTVKVMFRMHEGQAAPSKQPFSSAPKRSLLTLLARASRTYKCR